MDNKTKITVRTLANLAALALRHSKISIHEWRQVQLRTEAATYIHSAKLVASYAKI